MKRTLPQLIPSGGDPFIKLSALALFRRDFRACARARASPHPLNRGGINHGAGVEVAGGLPVKIFTPLPPCASDLFRRWLGVVCVPFVFIFL